MSTWAIFYGDGSVFEGEGDDIYDAIPVGVQAIAQDRPKMWHVVSHAHFYCLDDVMCFYGVDESGFWQYQFKAGKKFVLFGETIHTPVFQEIFQRALAYADEKRRE